MVDRKVPSDQAVEVPRYAFEAMAARAALGEDEVGIMLLILVRMNAEREVELDLDLLPRFLTVRPERVDRAVSNLIKDGWVTAVDEIALRSRILACAAHPAFLHSDFDTLMEVVTAPMFKAAAH